MEEIGKILLYAFLALIYFFLNAKKKQKSSPQQNKPTSTDPMEDFFEELKKRQQQEEKKQSIPVPTQKSPSFEKVSKPQKYSSGYAESGLMENSRRLKEIEDRIKEAQDRNKIDYETDSFEVESSSKFKSSVKKETTYYAKLLQNPKSVKDAIILSEILNRRY